MKQLQHLSNLLQRSFRAVDKLFPVDSSLDDIIVQLEEHTKLGASTLVPEDLQQQAVRQFWENQRFDNLKDARLVSFGMCIPNRPAGPCIMEDRQRFLAVLDKQTGVDQWLNEPLWYRRCYQGLLRSYFTYDAKGEDAHLIGRQNWCDLRDYLSDRTQNIIDKRSNPEWVTTTIDNRKIFSENPCAPYAAAVFNGDKSKLDYIREQLGIIDASWFLRELVLAQVRHATTLGHEQFKERIPFLLELLNQNQVLRNRGLIMMLDKYASTLQPALNEHLRNISVDWWGNPWLPSNENRWGGVVPAAREMVSDWLKREFIEAFFTKLAEDGVGDRRRANFWLRYVKSMDNIQFALGARALSSHDRDFVELRKKMEGLYTVLKTNDSSNNAFIMTIGNLVAVEFGGMGNAFYGYDIRKILPFDASKPVATTVDASNSLKHKNRMLRMRHQDGIKGCICWEDMFEATLEQHFNIRPNVTVRHADSAQTANPAPQTVLSRSTEFSLAALNIFAGDCQLKIEDFTAEGGNLWVRTDDRNIHVNQILRDWNFTYKPGKGWWK